MVFLCLLFISFTDLTSINRLKIEGISSLRLPLSGTGSRMDKRVTTFLYCIPGWLTPLIRGRRIDANV